MPLLGGRYRGAGTVAKFHLHYTPGTGLALMVMLADVELHVGSQIVVAQHVWTKATSEVAELDPRKGSRISFSAVVEEYYKFTDSGLERIDYGICQLEDVDLVAGGEGVSFAEYIGNLKQSQTFAHRLIEIPCPAA